MTIWHKTEHDVLQHQRYQTAAETGAMFRVNGLTSYPKQPKYSGGPPE